MQWNNRITHENKSNQLRLQFKQFRTCIFMLNLIGYKQYMSGKKMESE